MTLCVTLSDSIKISPPNCENGLFYSRQPSERTLVARTDFRQFKEFSLKMCYLKILILQIVYCDKKKNVSAGDRRKKHIVVTPKMTLIETFLARALYTIVILKLYLIYVYVGSNTIFSLWSYVFVINITREVKSLRICFSIYTLLSIHAQNAFQS